jgi:cytochrome c oxidase assembly factor 1
MERRSDRALPPLVSPHRWLRTLPIFGAIMVACTLAIFNYQKSNSSVVSSALYSLRTNEEARAILGDEIYFAQQLPWIWGTIDQVHGNIDVSFMVKGSKGKAMMRFKSVRRTRMGFVSLILRFSFLFFSIFWWFGEMGFYGYISFANGYLQFETVEWSLTPDGGETVSLLEGSSDPLQLEKAWK